MTFSRCQTPIEPALLADYWLAELEPADEERLEEHLFSCDDCSRELEYLTRLIDAIRGLTRKGLVRVILSEAFLERLRAESLSLRQYRVEPGGGVACTITDEDDMVIARLAANLTGAKRVDIARCNSDGIEQGRIRDIPLTRAGNEVVFVESSDTLRALGKELLRFRLIAVDGPDERVLGEYTFDHTPS